MDCIGERVDAGRLVGETLPSMVTVKMAGSTGFGIHFECRDDRVCWEHGRCTIYICWVKRYTEYSGLRQNFPWPRWNISLTDSPPPCFVLFPCSFSAVWWLTLCSTSPDSREVCPEHWTLGSLENIYNSNLVNWNSGLFVILLLIFLNLTISLCVDKVELQIRKREAQTLEHGGPAWSLDSVGPVLSH